MSALRASLTLSADARGVTNAARDANAALGRIDAAADRAAVASRGLSSANDGLETSSRRASGGVRALLGSLSSVGAVVVGRTLFAVSQEMAALEARAKGLSGSIEGGAASMAFARETAERLGLDLAKTADGWLSLEAATKGTSAEGGVARDVFLSVAEAGVANSASAERQARALYALQQMFSKGKVQAEEFRGQLGDALPQATRIGAAALGVTTAEFGRMLDSGELIAEDFLPRFAAALRKDVAGALQDQVNTPAREATRTMNALKEEIASFGAAGFDDGAAEMFASLREAVTDPELRAAAGELSALLGDGMQAAGNGAKWAADNIGTLKAAAGALIALQVGRWAASGASALDGLRIATVAAAQAKLQAANADRLAAAAALQTAQAARSAATSQMAGSAAIAAAKAQVTAATTALSLAEARAAAAANALSVATGQGTAAMLAKAGAARAAGAALAFMGGPLGLAITAVGVLGPLLWDSVKGFDAQKEAAKGAGDGLAAITPYIAEYERATREAADADGLAGIKAREAARGIREKTAATLEAAKLRFADARAKVTVAEQRVMAVNRAGVAPGADPGAAQLVLGLQLNRARADEARARGEFEAERRALVEAGLLSVMPKGQMAWVSPRVEAVPTGGGGGGTTTLPKQEAEGRSRQPRQPRATREPRTDYSDLLADRAEEQRLAAASDREQAVAEETARRLNAARAQGVALSAEQARVDAEGHLKAVARNEGQAAFNLAIQASVDASRASANSVALSADEAERLAIAADLYARAVQVPGDWSAAELKHFQDLANAQAAVQVGADLKAKGEQAFAAMVTESRDAVERQRATLGLVGLQLEAANRAAQSYNTLVNGRTDLSKQELADIKAIADAEAARWAAEQGALAFAEQRAKTLDELTEQAEAEGLYAGQTRDEREVTAIVEGEINRLKEAGIMLSAEQLAAYRAELAARVQGMQASRAANDALERATERMERAAEDVKESWVDAWDQMLGGSLDGFKDFGDALVKHWKSQILRELMRKFTVSADVQVSGGGGLFGGDGGIIGAIMGLFRGGSDGASGGGLAGLFDPIRRSFTAGVEGLTFTIDAMGAEVGNSFSRIAESFGAQAGGAISQLAGQAGGAFAGGGLGIAAASAVGLRGHNQQTWQAVGDTAAAVIGNAVGGPIGAAVATFVSRAIGGALADQDYAYARADLVVQNGQFVSRGVEELDGGAGAQVGEAAGGLAQALNAAATLFGINLADQEGTYTSFGHTAGRFGIGAGFFGGAINTGTGEAYDQTTDTIVRGRKGRANLEAMGTQYGHAVMGEDDAAEAALEVVRDTIIRMAERSGDAFTEAEIAIIRAATSMEEAAARIERGRTFAQSIEDAIEDITNPAQAARRRALAAVEADIEALKAEAQALIASGQVAGDVMGQIERLRGLRIDEALRELGQAAGDASAALRAAAPRLQQWLDRARTSEAAQLDPAEARQLAMAQYERVLERARAGDADALGDLTSYADALIAADRLATGDAQARLRLFEGVTGAVDALAQAGFASERDLLAELIGVTREGLGAVVTAVADADTTGVTVTVDPVTVDGTDAATLLSDTLGDTLGGFGWPSLDALTDWTWPSGDPLTDWSWPGNDPLTGFGWPSLDALTGWTWPSGDPLTDWTWPGDDPLTRFGWPSLDALTDWTWPSGDPLTDWSWPGDDPLTRFGWPSLDALTDWTWPAADPLTDWSWPAIDSLSGWDWPALPEWEWPALDLSDLGLGDRVLEKGASGGAATGQKVLRDADIEPWRIEVITPVRAAVATPPPGALAGASARDLERLVERLERGVESASGRQTDALGGLLVEVARGLGAVAGRIEDLRRDGQTTAAYLRAREARI